MNFKIKEWTDKTDEEQIKKEYLEGKLTTNKIQEKYGLGRSRASRLVKEARKEYEQKTGEKIIPAKIRNAKYYNNKNQIIKHINNTTRYYGRYSTEEQAKKAVQVCKDHNWDITIDEIKEILNEM